MEIKRKIMIKRVIFLPPRWGKLSVLSVPSVPRPVNIGDFERSIRPSIRPNVPTSQALERVCWFRS